MEVVAEGLKFPEGPIALDDGSVVLVELAGGTLSRVSPDGAIEVVAELGGGPNGAAVGPDGRIYVCNNGGFGAENDRSGYFASIGMRVGYVGGSIQAVDMQTGSVEVLYTECDGHPLSGPNDIVFDAHGGFWFTDLGKTWPRHHDHGGLYYASIDGNHIREVIYPLFTPNGVGLSPDGTTVYVAETDTGKVYRWQLSDWGVAVETSPRKALLYRIDGAFRLDSMAVDSAGHVCVATIGKGGGVSDIDAEDPTATVLVETGDPLTTNVCFGGPESMTAYITCSSSGTLRATEWPRSGLPLNF